jgi:hypothetical protein
VKHQNTREVIYKDQAAFFVSDRTPEEAPGPESRPHEPTLRDTIQAERAAMHPDRHDLEWPYCRGGWIG